jgi:hypothetical protein
MEVTAVKIVTHCDRRGMYYGRHDPISTLIHHTREFRQNNTALRVNLSGQILFQGKVVYMFACWGNLPHASLLLKILPHSLDIDKQRINVHV